MGRGCLGDLVGRVQFRLFGSVLFLPVWVVVFLFLFSVFPLGWCAVGWVFVGELGKVRRERAATNGLWTHLGQGIAAESV